MTEPTFDPQSGDYPKPTFEKTYRRVDGEELMGEYGWMTTDDCFDDLDEPVEVLVETWERTAVEVKRYAPSWWVDDPCQWCEESIAEHSDDEAAVCWNEAMASATGGPT